MTSRSPATDVPAEIRELNGLFLSFLRERRAQRADTLGLPGPVAAVLAELSDERLVLLAAYPQAMFRFELDALAAGDPDGPAADIDPDLADLQLMLLVSARNLCRQNPYAARLYLRLSAPQVRLLAALVMTDMPVLAGRHRLVRCAYLRLSWMWPELFRTADTDRERALILLGLQPNVELNHSALLNL